MLTRFPNLQIHPLSFNMVLSILGPLYFAETGLP